MQTYTPPPPPWVFTVLQYLGIILLYYIDTGEIPGFFLLLKNHIFIVRSEDTIFIFHV